MHRFAHNPLRTPSLPLLPSGRWLAGLAAAVLACLLMLLDGGYRAAPGAHAGATMPAAPTSPPVAHSVAAGQRQLHFEPNQGQAPKAVRYLSRGPLHSIEVFDDGMRLSARPLSADLAEPSARLRFVGANGAGGFETREPAPGKASYLHGSDPAGWIRDVPRYRQLRYAQLYAGIDLVYYSRDGQMEFDFVVRPGADPSRIRFHVDGAQAPAIADSGELLLDGAQGALRLHRPVLYQNIDGERKVLDGRYVLLGEREVGFEVAAYDSRYPLIIDPVFNLLHSTYLGGVHDDVVGGMVLDAKGNAYVVGHSGSEDWPVSGNAVQTARKNLGVYVRNVVVTKFDAAGTLVWSTFLGGSVNDYGRGIALDAAGRVVIAGQTLSSDFPTTANALQRQLQGSANAFIAVLSADGSALEYSSLYGGSGGSDATGLKIDATGQWVIAGSAGPGLATTAGAYQATLADGNAAFVARFDLPAGGGAALKAASYYGAKNRPAGQNNDNLSYAVALDASGAPWLTGQAFTRSLPVTADAAMAAPATLTASCQAGSVALNSVAYVAKLSADLKTLVYASYLTGRTGGPSTCAEFGRGIALDAAGSVYVAGSTSSLAFPTTPGALQATSPANAGFTGYAGFVLKLAADGRSLAWSTYLGGNGGNTFFSGITADSASNAVWVAGTTGGGSNFPLSADGQQRVFGGGSYDAAYHQLDAATGALKYGSYLGGSGNDDALALAVDGSGNAYIAGNTDSRNLTVTANAFQPAYTANAYDGNDWFFRIVGNGTIAQVQPAAAGNGGDATLRLNGSGLLPGSACALQGAAARIDAVSIANDQAGSRMDCSFMLAGAAPGTYDVIVTQPDGTVVRKAAAFAVQDKAVGPLLSAALVGRPAVRVGTPSRQQLTVFNSGDANAYVPMALLHVPNSLSVKLKLRKLGPAFPGDPTPYDGSFGPEQTSATESTYAVVFPVIPAGGSATLEFDVTAGEGGDDVEISASICPSGTTTIADWKASADPSSAPGASASRAKILAAGRARALLTGPQSIRCFGSVLFAGAGVAAGAAGLGLAGPELVVGAAMGALAGVVVEGFASAGEGGAVSMTDVTMNGLQSTIGATLSGAASNLFSAIDILKNCDPDGSLRRDLMRKIKRVLALDPNDKSGPVGDGSSAHYVATPPTLPYQIAFENKAAATAAAAEVVITDTLDPARFDLSTVSLGAISWGPHRIDVPPGLSSYSTIHIIDATMSVRVAGSLNPTTGVLKWTFTTLDPVTKLPPSDPTLGFLPPNANGTQGQGYVNFTVSPKAGLPEGTKWENAASIVFDSNPAIVTPTWVNTLDATPPAGRVDAAVQRAGGTEVDVAWSASDAGSGVRSYTVYVSEDGGPFSVWQDGVGTTSAVWAGTAGHSYGFYVVSADAVGNREAAKSAAEATVTVVDPAAAGSGDHGGCTIGGPDRRDASLPLLGLLAVAALAYRRRYRASKAVAP